MMMRIESSGKRPGESRIFLDDKEITKNVLSLDLHLAPWDLTSAMICFRVDKLQIDAETLLKLQGVVQDAKVKPDSE